ncbi:MAG: 1-phosphofructokinase family hexose kinase [Thermoanaerobaculia bacterium]
MKNILTLTVNPTIDKNTRVEHVRPEKKLRCERAWRNPGGGGVNVSRAIHRLGGTSTLLYLGGGATGNILEDLLEDEGLTPRRISIEGWTRENLIVYEERSEQQYRFGMPGPEVSEEEWQGCLDELGAVDPPPDYLVASGSLAPGMPEDFYLRVARVADHLGARLVADTSGEALRHLIGSNAFLLKPNVRELQDLAGKELGDEQEKIDAAQRLIAEGCCSVVVLSLGSGGAMLITADDSEHVRAPTVPIRSKVGAGDSMVAGIVLGLSRDMDLEDAVRFGTAAGAAAVMTEGTELCRREDTEQIYSRMKKQG